MKNIFLKRMVGVKGKNSFGRFRLSMAQKKSIGEQLHRLAEILSLNRKENGLLKQWIAYFSIEMAVLLTLSI
jgi:hypothetical protein